MWLSSRKLDYTVRLRTSLLETELTLLQSSIAPMKAGRYSLQHDLSNMRLLDFHEPPVSIKSVSYSFQAPEFNSQRQKSHSLVPILSWMEASHWVSFSPVDRDLIGIRFRGMHFI